MTSSPGDAGRQVELRVIGADYGSDSYATLGQVDELAQRLELGPGVRLLDLGSGRGWPGIHLARTTGCQVVLTDLPLDGLRIAAARVAAEALDGRCAVVRTGSGRHLPFAAGTFDAVVHTDVLC